MPGRKFYDICRALPDGCKIDVNTSGDRLSLSAGRSRFTLSTLNSSDFPTVDAMTGSHSLEIDQSVLRNLIEKTQFSMAQQDVRYYLNGLLLETEGKRLGERSDQQQSIPEPRQPDRPRSEPGGHGA